MLSRIWTSRGDSGAKTCELPGPYTESSRNSASTFVATAGFSKTWVMPRVVRRLASASTMRIAFSGLSAKRLPLLARWKQECNGGALSGCRLHLQARSDELRPFAHREESDGPLAAGDLHDVE